MAGLERKSTLPRTRTMPSLMEQRFSRPKNTLFRGPSMAQIDAHAGEEPGPGQYGAPLLRVPSGGRFNLSNPKSELEWVEYHAKQRPGPADYGAPKLPGPSGGRFNESKPKTELEWIEYYAAQRPGPADYGAPKLPGPSGGRFNMSKPKSELEWVEYRAAQLPGSADYDVKFEASSTPALKKAPSSRVLGKVVVGNAQTTMPSAVGVLYRTVNEKGPNQCDMSSSFLKQSRSDRPNAATIKFSTASGFVGADISWRWKPKREPRDPKKRAQQRFEKFFGYSPVVASGGAGSKSRPGTAGRGRPRRRRRRKFGRPLHSPGRERGSESERSRSPDSELGVETGGRAGGERPGTAPASTRRSEADDGTRRSRSPSAGMRRGRRRRRRGVRKRRGKKASPSPPVGRPVFGGTVPLSHQPPGVGSYSPHTSSFSYSPYSGVKAGPAYSFTTSMW